MEETEPNNMEVKRDSEGKIVAGSGPLNPAGRPKGKTLKEYAREYFLLKTEEEKREYLEKLEEKKPGFIWTMAEGQPHQTTDITSGDKPIPLLYGLHDNHINKEDSKPEETD